MVLGLGLALVAFLLGLFPQEPLRRRAEAALVQALGPGARLGSLRVVPLTLSAEARHLSFGPGSWRVSVERAAVRATAALLLQRRLHFRDVDVQGMSVIVLALPAGGGSGGSPPVLRIDSLRLRGGSLELRDETAGRVTLEAVEADGALGPGGLEVRVPHGAWAAAGRRLTLEARARVETSDRLEVRLTPLELSMGRSTLRAEGTLGSLFSPTPEIDWTAAVDVAEAVEGRGLAAAGEVTASGRIRTGPEGWETRAQASSRGLRVAGWPVEGLDLRLAGESRGGLGGEAAFTSRGARVRATARGLLAPQTGLEVSIDGLDLADVAGPRLRGSRGHARARLDGDPRGRLEAVVEAGAILGGSLSGQATLSAHGTVEVASRSVDLPWTLRAELAEAGRLRRLGVQAEGTARGVWPPQLEGEATAGGEARLGQRALPLAATASFRSQGAALEARASAELAGGRLQADLAGRGERVDRLEVHGEGVDLSVFDPGMRGTARLSLHLSGPLPRLSGRGRVDLEGVGYGKAEVGGVSADLALARGAARLAVAAPRLNLRAEAGDLRPGQATLRARFHLDGTPLEPIAPLLSATRPLGGRITGAVDVALPWSEPSRATAEARLGDLTLESGALRVVSEEPATLRYGRGAFEADDLRLAVPGGSARLRGRLGLGADVASAADLDLTVDLAALPLPADLRLRGSADAHLRLEGTLARPRGSGTLASAGLGAAYGAWPRVDTGPLRVELSGDILRLQPVTASVAGGEITLGGQAPLRELGPALHRFFPGEHGPEGMRMEVGWKDLSLADLLRAVRPATTAAARLSGRAELTGGLGALEEIAGSVTLDAADVTQDGLTLRLEPARLAIEKGRVRTEDLTFSTPGARLTALGGVDLVARTAELRGQGSLELRSLSPLLAGASLGGLAELDVSVTGPWAAPSTRGRVRLRDGSVRMRDFPQPLTELTGDLAFEGDAVRVGPLRGRLGGGALELSGSASISGGNLAGTDLRLAGREVALSYPPGLRSRMELDLSLSGRTGAFRLGGDVRVQRGVFDLEPETAFRAAAQPVASSFLRSVALDLDVRTVNPVQARGNTARFEVGGALRVGGTLESPAPLGTLDVTPGGTVLVGGREFTLEQGRLTYRGGWDPEVDVRAGARIRDANGNRLYAVSLGLGGTLEKPGPPEWGIDADLSAAEVESLVATGDSREKVRGLQVAGLQAAAFLVGSLAQQFRRLGFDEVSLQPELVARDGAPGTGARFTFGRRLSARAGLVYSHSLSDPEQRFIRVEVQSGREATVSAQRQDDGAVAGGLGRRFRRGGPPRARARREERVRLREIRFEGDRPFAEARLLMLAGLGPGRRASVWDVQRSADRLRERLAGSDYLEATVSGRLEGEAAVLLVRSGARYEWEVSGSPVSVDVSSAVRTAFYEEEALEAGRARVLERLGRMGYVEARVLGRAASVEGGRRLSFVVTPGRRFSHADVTFPGAKAVSSGTLLKAAGGASGLLSDPDSALEAIREAYRRRHHLEAAAGPVHRQERGEALVLEVPVREGRRARLASVRLQGARRPEEELRRALALPAAGTPFDERRLAEALPRLQDHYFALGYAQARLSGRVEAEGGDYAFVVEVDEGARQVVGEVVVRGLRRTREGLVRRRIDLRPGQPIDPRVLARVERRLLDLGVFSRVSGSVSGTDPAIVTFEVEEGERYLGGFDVRGSREEGLSALVDAEVRNVAGRGLSLGARHRRGADVRETRVNLHAPLLTAGGGLTLSGFDVEEDPLADPDGPRSGPRNTLRRTGVQVDQTLTFSPVWSALVGYRFKRTALTSSIFVEPIVVKVAGLQASVLRDTRDSALDPTRGDFGTVSFEYSPASLGSDLTFVKGLMQLSQARPLGDSLVWAQGLRLGLGRGFGGQRVISFERFQAGGANTVRGFATDSLGPQDRLGEATGGEAVLVLNEELRYRHPSGLGGVAFWDAGNVFDRSSDLGLDLRHALGLGLRWQSPVGLLRLDLGFPLARKPGEKGWQLFFSLGQAF